MQSRRAVPGEARPPDRLRFMLALSALRFCNPSFPTTRPKFTEEDSRAKEEEILNDSCHMVANRWHRLPCCIVSKPTRERVFSPHPQWPVQGQPRELCAERMKRPALSHTAGWPNRGANSGEPAYPGLCPPTWLLSNLLCFFLNTDRGQEHRL